MVLAVIVTAVGVGLLILGLKGFSAEGIPFSSTTTLKGSTARVVGIVCLVLGSPIALFGFWLIIKIAQMPPRR